MVLTYDLLENGHIDDVCFLIIKITISLDCDWFKKPLFSTNSLAKLLSDSLLSDSLLSDSSVS